MTADFLGARLAAQGEALERMVSRTSAEHFERRPQADKWSAREHLAHLACYQQRFLERLRAILSRDRPSFQRYRAEEDEDWPEWQRLASDEIHERLQAIRRELLTVVASLSESQLDRVGLHPVFGAMTIPQWIDFFLFHEGHHAYQVMALAMRGSSSARLTTPGRRGI